MFNKKIQELEKIALDMRINVLKMCNAVDGPIHIGGDLSLVDILTVLYKYKMNVSPKNITSRSRDRLILSKGHCAAAQYVIMSMCGFFDMDEIFKTYGKLDSKFGMHPCKARLPELECSSGSLGHGLSIGIGKALAARINHENYRTFVLMGDGEIQEGSNWEAAMSASQYKLGNLVGIIDNNKMQLDGLTSEIMNVEPLDAKWRSFGWNVLVVDGHNIRELVLALDKLPEADTQQPTMIICNTIKGKGISFMENQPQWHAGSIDDETLLECIKELKSNSKGDNKIE